MHSDHMNNQSLLVGKHCMELSEVIRLLCERFTLFTTDLAAMESFCTYPNSIQDITFSEDEMSELIAFYSENECLQKIGFAESSLLFIAKRRKIRVAAVDIITQRVCDELGIDVLKVQRKNPEPPNAEPSVNESRLSRLGLLKIAACL